MFNIDPNTYGFDPVSWIGLTDRDGGRFSKTGLCGVEVPETEADLCRGTIMFETHAVGDDRPHDLLCIKAPFAKEHRMLCRAMPDGGITMAFHDGSKSVEASVPWVGRAQRTLLRVAFAWDCSRDCAQLSVEWPDRDEPYTRSLAEAPGIDTGLARELMLGSPRRFVAPEVQFAAVSAAPEPIGPMPSLHPTVPIATPGGYRPVASLKRGDTVISNTGEVVPVLFRVEHTLPARGSFAPVRLHAPYFGLQRDIIVSPEQRLVLHGSEVEYLFDQEAVLVPARHVVNGHAARFCAPVSTAKYVQLVLPKHEALIAAGCPLESLYIGRIRRSAARLNTSVLADISSKLLPEHGQPIHPVLRPVEAVTLIHQRAA